MWEAHDEREMRAQLEAEQMIEQLEKTIDEIAQAEKAFQIYEQGEQDPI